MVSDRTAAAGRARSLWPLPGGSGHYLGAAREFVRMAMDAPRVEVFIGRVRDQYPSVSSDKAARAYARVVADLGLLVLDRGMVRVTESGKRFAGTADRAVVRKALEERIVGVKELLAELKRDPDRIGLLAERMRERGYAWKGQSQIRYRLRWLEEVGAVRQHGRARPVYSLADWGCQDVTEGA